jgi:hypothetical protein
MANKSSKSPTGEEREQNNPYQRDQELEQQDIKGKSGQPATSTAPRKQENVANRGYEEDQPNNPVRNSGSGKEQDQEAPAGEPEKNGE